MATTEDIDVFDAPTPGQSLTDEPKKWQWERPPVHATPKEATNMIIMKLQEPDTYRATLDLMYAGITIESITKSLTFMSFTQGLMTPDVAEISNLYIFFYLRGMARKAGIRPRLFNSNDMAKTDVPKVMSSVDPSRYKQIINATEKPKESGEIVTAFMEMKGEPIVREAAMESPEEEIPAEITDEEIPAEITDEELPITIEEEV